MYKKIMIAVIVLTTAIQSFAGWEYTAVTKANGKNEEQMNSLVHGWADGDKAKVAFSQSENPMMPTGSYLISKDAGNTMYLVNPSKQQYSKWDIKSMMGMAGGAMQMMGVKFSTPKVEKLLDEKGPKMSGFSTRHYRFRTSYTMTMGFLGIKRSTDTLMEEDVWVTDELKDLGLQIWLNQKTAKTGNEELDKMLEAEMSKIKGFPLKRIATTTTTDSDGSKEVTKLIVEVTSIKKTHTPASLFEAPKGYKETPMFSPATMMNNPPSSSSKQGGKEKGSGENPFLQMMRKMQEDN